MDIFQNKKPNLSFFIAWIWWSLNPGCTEWWTVTRWLTYSVYRSPSMEKMMTHMVTTAMWYPVPISEENSRALEAGRNTSPWTCFQPYSSPKSFSYKSKHILIYWQMDCNGSISNNMTELNSLHQFTIPITGRSEIRVQCKIVIIRENLEVFN